MNKYFTSSDFAALQRKISEVMKKLDETSKAIGEACNQSSETTHDNFPYEEAVRQQALWSRRLDELSELSQGALVVRAVASNTEVRIGKHVELEDLMTGEVKTHRIGSFNVASYSSDESAISYNSPLGNRLLGARVDDIRVLEVEGRDAWLLKVRKIEDAE